MALNINEQPMNRYKYTGSMLTTHNIIMYSEKGENKIRNILKLIIK